MDEEDLDALRWRPFGTKDAAQWEAQNRENTGLVMTLGTALWGKTPADLQHQLLAPHPEIPSRFGLADFHKLLQWTAQVSSAALMYQRLRGLPAGVVPAKTVFVGAEGFTEWEARREIVRRAIDHLKGLHGKGNIIETFMDRCEGETRKFRPAGVVGPD